MLTGPAQFLADIQEATTNFHVCWAITKRTGDVLRGTDHVGNITIDDGPYAGEYRADSAIMASDIRSSTDGGVQNVEVEGAFQIDAMIPDLTVEEVEAGVYDQAEAVLFMVNADNPNAWQKVLMFGTLGQFQRDSDGKYRTEVRGLTQMLSQQIVRTYSQACNVARFGDDRCKFDVASKTRTGTVSAVTDRKNFVVTLDAGPAPVTSVYYNGGELRFTTGDNSGFAREVRLATLDVADLTVSLWDEAAADVEVGNEVEVEPGCDRNYQTCRDVHENLVNFRGYGIFAVGRDRLLKGPDGAGSESDDTFVPIFAPFDPP